MAIWFSVIGDVVGSRALPDRSGAQLILDAALGDVNAFLTPAQLLEPTVGDEFQGAFATLREAVLATLLVRLCALPEMDVRCGIGYGEVTVHDAERQPLLQDGPGWWAAREALVVLAQPKRTPARTWYVGPDPGQVNALLLTRDSLVDRLGDRGRRMLALALRGLSQKEIGELEGVSKSAVSQQFARGVGAIRDAHLEFGREAVT